MPKTTSRTVYEIPLCQSISLRYSVSVTKSASKHALSNGYYNNARFYLYSTVLKKQIGADYRKEYPFSKKAVAISVGQPSPTVPSKQIIQAALEGLLTKNAGLSPTQEKVTSTGPKQIILNEDELFVYWLTHYQAIADRDTSIRTDEDRQKAFAKVCRGIGDFRLSSLCTPTTSELDKACQILVSGIKQGLRGDSETATSNTDQKTRIVRLAISVFLKEMDIDPTYISTRIQALSIPKKTVSAKIAENMRPQSLSIAQYQRFYHSLCNDGSDLSKALQLMLLLGLRPEEVCGLNWGDVQNITGYYNAIQLNIIRLFRKEGNTYKLTHDLDENTYRKIPLPFPLNKSYEDRSKHPESNALLIDANGKRLKPDSVWAAFSALVASAANPVRIVDHGMEKDVDLTFRDTSYRASCRFYWHYYCGLSEDEIRYLGGLSPTDTLSAHYLDHKNATQQYRMLKQLEHGIAMITRGAKPTPSGLSALTSKTTDILGGQDSMASITLIIDKPCQIHLSSWRGLQIIKEVDSE